MKLNFDLRGFDTVYDLSLTLRLFKALEKQLKVIERETEAELRREMPVESEEDHMILSSTLTGLEREHVTQELALRSAEIIRLFVLFEGHLKDFCKAVATERGLRKRGL